MHKAFLTSIIVFVLFAFACNSPFIPKKKGYEKVNFPNHSYQVFNEAGYPYSFEYPVYAQIEHKVNYFGDNSTTKGWININIPSYNATVFVSYKAILPHQFDTLVKDAYTFANNHNSKASAIEDSIFTTQNGIHGVFFHIGGDVATNYQFFLTDSLHHFFRGALYFDTTPNEDSLAPANAFLFKDLTHLVNTFKWQ
jgi:gliding motility-associated lipoprotein GldD